MGTTTATAVNLKRPIFFWLATSAQLLGMGAMLFVSQVYRRPEGLSLAVTWPWLRFALVGIALYSIAFSFFMTKLIGQRLEALQAKGKDREYTEVIILNALAATPGMYAFFYFLAGGSRMDFYLWCGVSATLLSYWTWKYRHRFGAGI